MTISMVRREPVESLDLEGPPGEMESLRALLTSMSPVPYMEMYQERRGSAGELLIQAHILATSRQIDIILNTVRLRAERAERVEATGG